MGCSGGDGGGCGAVVNAFGGVYLGGEGEDVGVTDWRDKEHLLNLKRRIGWNGRSAELTFLSDLCQGRGTFLSVWRCLERRRWTWLGELLLQWFIGLVGVLVLVGEKLMDFTSGERPKGKRARRFRRSLGTAKSRVDRAFIVVIRRRIPKVPFGKKFGDVGRCFVDGDMFSVGAAPSTLKRRSNRIFIIVVRRITEVRNAKKFGEVGGGFGCGDRFSGGALTLLPWDWFIGFLGSGGSLVSAHVVN